MLTNQIRALHCRTMAEQANGVATVLNRLADGEFTAALSIRDRGSLAELVEEFFCSASSYSSDEEEEELDDLGMQ